MRISSILRIATIALALTSAAGVATSALAASRVQQQQAANSSPYDSPDFVVAPNNIHN